MSTFPDMLRQFGGAPVGGGYHGWWGRDIWFVDDDSGSDGNSGQKPEKAFKTIQKAINSASLQDTIYLKPREIGGAAYPGYSAHGYYTGTLSVPQGKAGLSIIGTGKGVGIGSKVQVMIEPASGSTDSTLTVASPAFTIENCGLKAVTSATGAIVADRGASVTTSAYGLTVSNCFFKDFKATGGSTGTINLISTHWSTIQHCIFREAGMAINLSSGLVKINGPVIRDCTFTGVASDWSVDIRVGDVKGIEIDSCRFLHATPTGGRNIYIDNVGTAVSGIMSNLYFADTSATASNYFNIPDAIEYAGCWANDQIT